MFVLIKSCFAVRKTGGRDGSISLAVQSTLSMARIFSQLFMHTGLTRSGRPCDSLDYI